MIIGTLIEYHKYCSFFYSCYNKVKRYIEIFRFGIVGILATIIHYGVYLSLLHFMHESVAYSIGYVISLIGNFFASNYYTFKTKPTAKKGAGFVMSHFVNYCLHIIFLNTFLWIGLKEEYAPIPVFFIVVPINFVLVRFVLKK